MRLVAAAALLLTLVLPAAPAAADTPRDLTTLPGTAWWTDPETGDRTVAADASVSARDLARLAKQKVSVVREPGVREKHIAGGDRIFPNSSASCSVGFNVRMTVAPYGYYFITSGHCVGPVGSTVKNAAGTVIGTVVQRLNPNDFALVKYVTTVIIAHPSAVNRYDGTLQPITTFGSAFVGQQVQRAGSTTGLWGGVVTALNVTVNYSEGTVHGLIRTTVCSEAGDSGGPLFSTTIGLGLTSGGSGNCTSGGVTYFAPVLPYSTAYSVGPW